MMRFGKTTGQSNRPIIFKFTLTPVIPAMILFSLFSLVGNKVDAREKPVITLIDKSGVMWVGTRNIRIEIYSDGKVHYFGDGTMVYEKGERFSNISKTKLNKLIRAFLHVRFFEVKPRPSLMELWHPPLILPRMPQDQASPPAITFNYKNQIRTLSSGVDFIYSLEEKIFRAINIKQWVCHPPSDPYHKQCNYWYLN
ncbi:MAG: hypothetical protein Q8L68_03125 [Methylococcales bacterium]|nr:hypothetical protein [Methylococcales bacterium]